MASLQGGEGEEEFLDAGGVEGDGKFGVGEAAGPADSRQGRRLARIRRTLADRVVRPVAVAAGEPGPAAHGRQRDGDGAQRSVTNPAPGLILRARSAVPAAAAGEGADRPEGGAAW